MPSSYTPLTTTWSATHTLPSDGDKRTAASVNTPLQSIADNLHLLKAQSLTQFVNVTDPAFGAVGDGVTDDTAAIQAAIDYIHGLTVPYGTVYFPPGTYLMTNVTWEPGVNLVGAGVSSHLLITAANGLIIEDPGNMSISGLKMSYNAAASYMIDIRDDVNLVIEDCSFGTTSFSCSALIHSTSAVHASTKIWVSRCQFAMDATTYGIFTDTTTAPAITVNNCAFTAANGYTADLIYGGNITVTNTTFDCTLCASGSSYNTIHLDGDDDSKAIVHGCRFLDYPSASFGVPIYIQRGYLQESDNIFDPGSVVSFGASALAWKSWSANIARQQRYASGSTTQKWVMDADVLCWGTLVTTGTGTVGYSGFGIESATIVGATDTIEVTPRQTVGAISAIVAVARQGTSFPPTYGDANTSVATDVNVTGDCQFAFYSSSAQLDPEAVVISCDFIVFGRRDILP